MRKLFYYSPLVPLLGFVILILNIFGMRIETVLEDDIENYMIPTIVIQAGVGSMLIGLIIKLF